MLEALEGLKVDCHAWLGMSDGILLALETEKSRDLKCSKKFFSSYNLHIQSKSWETKCSSGPETTNPNHKLMRIMLAISRRI